MVEPEDYGIVKVISGKHAGRIGYYDDDEGDDLAIILFGAHTDYTIECAYLPYDAIEPASQDDKIAYEMEVLSKIPPELRDKMDIHP